MCSSYILDITPLHGVYLSKVFFSLWCVSAKSLFLFFSLHTVVVIVSFAIYNHINFVSSYLLIVALNALLLEAQNNQDYWFLATNSQGTVAEDNI